MLPHTQVASIVEHQPIGALDVVARWRPKCHCWIVVPLHPS